MSGFQPLEPPDMDEMLTMMRQPANKMEWSGLGAFKTSSRCKQWIIIPKKKIYIYKEKDAKQIQSSAIATAFP